MQTSESVLFPDMQPLRTRSQPVCGQTGRKNGRFLSLADRNPRYSADGPDIAAFQIQIRGDVNQGTETGSDTNHANGANHAENHKKEPFSTQELFHLLRFRYGFQKGRFPLL